MPHDYIAARAAAEAKAALPLKADIWVKYARKSSEGTERQSLSIPSQLQQIDSLFPALDYLDEPVTESKSAFHPGRKKFGWIIEQVEAGEITGIVSWHPNRLSRNPHDAATIVRLIAEDKLDLKFVTFSFEKTPEGLLLLEQILSQGRYESLRLARDVARGTTTKVEQGWYPGPVPLGYKTDGDRKRKGERTIVVDEFRMPIIERGLKHALTGNYTVAELHGLMASDWGLTTRKTEKRGSQPIGYLGVWGMLRNVFYTGHFLWKGELRRGKHKAVITLQQYERLQEIFRHTSYGDSRRKPSKRGYIKYSGLLTCLPCGRAITATEKRKYYPNTQREASYIYYHCSRGTRRTCTEHPISEPKLTDKILSDITGYRFMAEYRDLAFDLLIKDFQAKNQDRLKEVEGHKREVSKLEDEARTLTKMRTAGELDAEGFKIYYTECQQRILALKKIISREPELDWDKLVGSIKAIHFALGLEEAYTAADPAAQRRLLIELASTASLDRGKVHIEAKKWLRPLHAAYIPAEASYELDRTSDFGSPKAKSDSFRHRSLLWCARAKTVAYLVEEELRAGRSVHPDLELPDDLICRISKIRPEQTARGSA
ncbi:MULTISPECIES: recombinase family protein [Kitasatospora]|uniref:Resolvase/invertase-type recombinase catalytic domain-containing protein n=1 Tax=Kitasatospora setae (strain ATCC 33774 / DSM 43861 / JCM 3304 / KCC A-0304 / NBRC 14216 / KM-6054) TaxID=452652 RepID=E4NHK6_KITSK|nr:MULTISPECIES: recombinase family protein [Kitasatospora]BAJ30986.1 hypothetical protein KSE_52090 [Kitasatospora setae KM-6054]